MRRRIFEQLARFTAVETSLLNFSRGSPLCGLWNHTDHKPTQLNKSIFACPSCSPEFSCIGCPKLGALSQQGFGACQNIACPAHLSPAPSSIQFTEQAVTVYWLGRNLSQSGVRLKSLTAIQDPDNSNWNGRQCTAVLAHEGRLPEGGHWIAFLRENGVWWRVDSNHSGPRRENPFANQMRYGSTVGYTIDIVFFS